MTNKSIRYDGKRLVALIMVIAITFATFVVVSAEPSISIATNGNARKYGPGANLVIVGEITDSGMPLPNADLVANVTLSHESLVAIAAAGDGNVTVTASLVQKDTLTEVQAEQVGDRPVYNIGVTVGNKEVSQFNGNVTVSMPYTLAQGEDANAIVIYYINSTGELSMVGGIYDTKTGSVKFTTTHFSLYMVGHNLKSFDDTKGHWASSDIIFVAARDLFVGTGDNLFSPDDSMTYAMFITVLSRLDKASLSVYDNSTWFSAPMQWAKARGFLAEIGDVNPAQNIIREDMALIFAQYVKSKKLLTQKGDSVTFKDDDEISDNAKEAIYLMSDAGIIKGKNGDVFDTKGEATRAEVSNIFTKLVQVLEQ